MLIDAGWLIVALIIGIVTGIAIFERLPTCPALRIDAPRWQWGLAKVMREAVWSGPDRALYYKEFKIEHINPMYLCDPHVGLLVTGKDMSACIKKQDPEYKFFKALWDRKLREAEAREGDDWADRNKKAREQLTERLEAIDDCVDRGTGSSKPDVHSPVGS